MAAKNAVTDGLKKIEQSTAGDAALAALVEDVRKRQGTFEGGVGRIVSLVQAGKQAEATFAADEEMIPMMAPFLASLVALDKQVVKSLHEIEAANTQGLQSLSLNSAAAGGLAIVLAMAAGSLLAVSLTRPLIQALKHAQSVASGDLSMRAHAAGRNEIAQLL